MHPALFLDEILRVVFAHCYAENIFGKPRSESRADLVSLATTCQAFKNPALDLLWMKPDELSQLVRCLPSACRVKYLADGKRMYLLERDLEPAEANTLKAYTRRIRVLHISQGHGRVDLDPDTIRNLCRTPQIEPLFPNLRELYLSVTNDNIVLLPHVAVQNIRRLSLLLPSSDSLSCEDFMRSLSSTCPGMQAISVKFSREGYSTTSSRISIQNIDRWTHLLSMHCFNTIMDVDTFFHISRLPSLTELSFALESLSINQIEASNHAFVLPALQRMALYITSIVRDSKFLTHMRLPALKKISLYYSKSLPKAMIRSFAMALRAVCNHKLVAEITLEGSWSSSSLLWERTTLVLEDVLPFAAFNLTHMRIELNWIVDMKDDDLVRLASDCPRIESLSINSLFGWRSAGITPVGLLKVLRLCPLLRIISTALDTRGYQVLPHHELDSSSSIGGELDPLPAGRLWRLHLVDSVIEAESVPALAAFFADCMPSGAFAITSWMYDTMKRFHSNWRDYQKRWRDVSRMAKVTITERSKRSGRPHFESMWVIETGMTLSEY